MSIPLNDEPRLKEYHSPSVVPSFILTERMFGAPEFAAHKLPWLSKAMPVMAN